MAKTKTFAGLDVHATQTQAAAFDVATGELRSKRLSGPPSAALEYLSELRGPLVATYEAGPTGYGLARAAAEAGFDVRVCAPGAIHRKPTDRIKTDRRDAERLARLLAAGELSFVRVPSPEQESCRDLSRCREAVRGDLMRARHRLSKLLLRREIPFQGPGQPWGDAHRRWLRARRFNDSPAQTAFSDYLLAVEMLEQRRDVLDQAIEELWPQSPWAETIARLRCLRGIDTLTAFGLCAEVLDFRRFSHPAKLGAYLGIVPSEYSSGEAKRRGPITKAGSGHARRLLVEAALQSWRRPAIGARLAKRQQGQDPRAVAIGWRAQHRLHRRWQHLRDGRGKRGNVVILGLARELSCFVWEVGQLD